MHRRTLPLILAAGLGGLALAVWTQRPAAPPAAPVARPTASPAAIPLARPGLAWPLVQQRLADGLAGLDLPPAGLRVDLVVKTDTNGTITATNVQVAGTAPPAAVTRLVNAATLRVPFALDGPAGQYRLWLKLVPAQPPAETGSI